MAFLGGLFGDIKTKDVGVGIAKAVSRELQDSMDKTDDNVSRLSQLRLDRVMRDQQAYDTDLAANVEIIKDMVGKVGSEDAVAYLISEHGFAEAKVRADELNKKVKLSGGVIKPTEYLGIEKSTGGAISAMTLADYVTPSKKVPSVSEFGDAGIGIASSLFGYGEGEFKRRSDADIAAAGYSDRMGKTALTDLPEVEARGLYEWQVYSKDNPLEQAGFLGTVQTRLLKKEMAATTQDEKDKLKQERLAAKTEQDIMLEQAEMQEKMKNKLVSPGPLTRPDILSYSAQIGSSITVAQGLQDDGNWTTDGSGQRIWVGAALSAVASDEIQKATQGLLPELNKAAIDGQDPASLFAALKKAARSNTTFKYVPTDNSIEPPIEGSFVFDEESSLVNTDLKDEAGTPVFPGLIPVDNNASSADSDASGASSTAASSTAATASVGNTQTAAIQTIANQKSAYRGTNNPTQKATIVSKIMRQLARSGVTMTQAEVEAELSK